MSLKSRDSSVGREAGCDLRTRRAIASRGKIPALEPTLLPIQWVPGRETDLSPPSSV